jgi:hypothetical protein
MPTQIGRSPTITFRYLFDRMWRHVCGLSNRPLSRMGNEIMLKAVIQAIPTYVMSCFQLLAGTCEEIWEWLSSPKDIGGMGFRDQPSNVGSAV